MMRFFPPIILYLSVAYSYRRQSVILKFRVGKTLFADSSIQNLAGKHSFLQKIEEGSYEIVTNAARFLSPSSVGNTDKEIKDNIQNMESAMAVLDKDAAKKSLLNRLDVTLLFGAVATSVISPMFFSGHVVALIVPAMAGVSFSVGSLYEYFGKVAVADGKETLGTCFQTVAESDVIYCQAERVKSVLPLCVGIATTAAVLSLLVPRLLETSFPVGAEVLTALFSLIGVLAAAIAGLANEETGSLVVSSMEVGQRRFTTRATIGNVWESETEKVMGQAEKFNNKWFQFAIGVLPAPLIASFFPVGFENEGIICSAIAAAQAAYYLVLSEYSLTRGLDALVLRWRAAALAEQYAKQGARAGSTLPFLTALGGLCLGFATATAEAFPFIPSIAGRMMLAAVFPTTAAIFAAASIVRKDQCEIDAKAALSVAETGMTGSDKNFVPKDPKLKLLDLFGRVFANLKQELRSWIRRVLRSE